MGLQLYTRNLRKKVLIARLKVEWIREAIQSRAGREVRKKKMTWFCVNLYFNLCRSCCIVFQPVSKLFFEMTDWGNVYRPTRWKVSSERQAVLDTMSASERKRRRFD